jgi:opacity protein-like surface antigen
VRFVVADLRKSGTVAPLFDAMTGNQVLQSSFDASQDIHDLASIRGRIGYVWNNDWLGYFTGGGAWIDRNLSADAFCPSTSVGGGCVSPTLHGPVNFHQTDWGWVLGGGLEYKVANSPWILGVEYLYYHFNATTASSPLLTITGTPFFSGECQSPSTQCFFYTFNDTTIQTVRARLSYKFY